MEQKSQNREHMIKAAMLVLHELFLYSNCFVGHNLFYEVEVNKI